VPRTVEWLEARRRFAADVLADDGAKYDQAGDKKSVEKARRRREFGCDVGRRIEVNLHCRHPARDVGVDRGGTGGASGCAEEWRWLPTNWASHNVVSVGSLGIVSAVLAGDTGIRKE
jgi:hypothetical protein